MAQKQSVSSDELIDYTKDTFPFWAGHVGKRAQMQKAPPFGGALQITFARGLGQCSLGLRRNRVERIWLVHSQIGQNLTIYFDASLG